MVERQLSAPTNNIRPKRVRLSRPWLERDQNGQLTLIPERARAVQWIFAEYVVRGHGDYDISQRIWRRYKPFDKSKRWHPNAIRRILTNPAVLENDLIDLDLFNRAQDIRGSRKKSQASSPRKGRSATNLLKDLAFCIHCESRLYKKPSEKMLVCSGCGVANQWPHEHIEKVVLRHVELGLPKLLGVVPGSEKKEQIEEAVHLLEDQGDKMRRQVNDYLKLTEINPNLTYVAEQLAPLQRQLNDLHRRLERKQQELGDIERAERALNRKAGEIKEAIAKLQTEDHRRKFASRSEVHARLKSVIKKVWVTAAGLPHLGDEDEKLDGQPVVMIESKGGSEMWITPNMKDPYGNADWGFTDGDDAREVFPDL